MAVLTVSAPVTSSRGTENRPHYLDPQTAQVLKLIKRDGFITRLVAAHYGIANLTARISDLRSRNVKVACETKRDAEGRRYGYWTLAPNQRVDLVGV